MMVSLAVMLAVLLGAATTVALFFDAVILVILWRQLTDKPILRLWK